MTAILHPSPIDGFTKTHALERRVRFSFSLTGPIRVIFRRNGLFIIMSVRCEASVPQPAMINLAFGICFIMCVNNVTRRSTRLYFLFVLSIKA